MSDSAMLELSADLVQPGSFLHTVLTTSLTAVAVLRPLYEPGGTSLRDFAWVYLNPAGQRLTGQPERPSASLLTLFPTAQADGVFGKCRQAFETGAPQRNDTSYQADGLDNSFVLVAQRHQDLLVVSFAATNDRPRSAVALRQRQAREQAARAEAKRQRAELQRSNEDLLEARVRERTAQVREQQRLLQHALESVPAAIATLSGPEHRFSFANAQYQRLVGNRVQVGQAVAEALPEVVEQGVIELLDRVYQTGEPFIGRGVMLMLEQPPGPPHQYYYDLTYLPLRDGQDQVQGILVFAVEVTEQVRNRRQTTQLQTELLAGAQRQVQQREELYQIFEQAPAAVALLREPDHRIEYVNPAYQQLFPEVALRGRRLAEAHPGLRASGALARIDQAYQTGVPYVGEAQPVAAAQLPGQPGLPRYFTFVYHPYREAGSIVGVSVFAYEVTEQVLARQQLEQFNQELEARVQARTQEARAAQAAAERERAQLQALLAQAPVAIGLFEGDELRVSAINLLMAGVLGYEPAQLLGYPLFERAPELQGQGFDELMRQVQATQVPYIGREVAATVQRQGSPLRVYFNFVYQPLYDDEGRVTGIINVAVDVTEQVVARQQLEQLNQKLEARVQARTRELAEQQGLLSQILGQVPAAVATLSGPEHRFTFFNEEYQRLNDQRTRLGATLAEVVPEAAELGFSALLDEVYRTGQPYVGTEAAVQLQQAGGRAAAYYVDFRYQPLHDEAGQVRGILIFAVDVTRQVHARQQAAALQADLLAAAQRQAAERESFYQVFEQTTAVVALLRGPQHRYEYANPSYQALLPGRQLAGRTVAEAAPELVAQGFGALLDHVYQTGETYFGEALPFTTDPAPGQAAHTAYFNFTYQAYREAGEVAGVSVFAFDVTEQVLGRQQQQAQAQRLRHIFAQAPVAIFVLRGADYVFDVVNESMGQMLGLAPDYVRGKRYFDLLPTLEEQGYRQLLDQVWHTGREYTAQEQAARLPHHGEGETGYYNFVYVPLHEADGRITGIMCVAVDVTAQVLTRQQVQALNDELQASNAQLTRTNADLDTFVYTASHDLKAPITNIEGLLLALRRQLPPEAQQAGLVPRLLELMQGAIVRFQQTLGHLTEVSRLHYSQSQPAEAIDLAALVEDVRLDILPELTATGATLALDLAACPTVYFSPKNLRSVVYNLLSNAVKYHAPDRPPQVQVRCHRASTGALVLEIQDNGLGLSEQQQGELFHMFRRLHTHVEGSGVGLYMVKKLLENAGGSIAVQSQPGVGTTFAVTLPAAP